MNRKWFAPVLPYFAVWVGLFIFHNAWLALVGFHLAIVIALFWLRPVLPVNVLIKPASWNLVLLNILVCSLGGVGLYFLWDILGVAHNLSDMLQRLGLNDSTWLGLIVYFSLANPFFEEYFWRGALGSDATWFYVGDLIYAGYHVLVVWNKAQPQAILLMLCSLVAAGWFWRQLYRRNASLLAPMLGHMAADFSILLAVYFKVR